MSDVFFKMWASAINFLLLFYYFCYMAYKYKHIERKYYFQFVFILYFCYYSCLIIASIEIFVLCLKLYYIIMI